MSDPEVPKNEQHHDVDDVVGRANEGLDAAAAARADVPRADDTAEPVDPDMEAFAAAERDHPGTFQAPEAREDVPNPERRDDAVVHEPAPGQDAVARDEAAAQTAVHQTAVHQDVVSEPLERPADAPHADQDAHDLAGADRRVPEDVHESGTRTVADPVAPGTSEHTRVLDTDQHGHSVADRAYASANPSAETQVVPAEPVAPPAAPQPIFVQAPEPPRELGNRGAAGAIGLVAAVAFALLYLAAILGFGALRGEVTVENIGTAALEPLTMWSFWVPVAVFFLAFWLLGAFLNRARWGLWVILGLLVAAATYGGYLLGQLFQAPFWRITGTQSVELVNEQLLAPLAIACFIFARELTIWFGAWVARSGRRKTELNAEAQAEYERTLEAGPAALR
ncbi:ABC transporter [Microbacterium sp. USHLN186]|uniref:ABC transporter n=1 Tax=Microbacterium sp. USHLN186 TaxID=3081286 RepID=UPI00301819C2